MAGERRIDVDLLGELAALVDEQCLISLVKDLVRIPSYPGLPAQESAVAQYIADFLSAEGIEVELVPILDGRQNVLARLKGLGKNNSKSNDQDNDKSNHKSNGRSLLLLGHLDTVPPYNMSGNPFEAQEENGHLRGRGTVDMKGSLACMLMALVILKRVGIELAGEVNFAGVIDEEEKSAGTRAFLQSGLKVDAALIGEPTDLNIGLGHRGLEWLEFTFTGTEVHGGAQSGINAIAHAAKFVARLENDLQPQLARRRHAILGPATMNYGSIHGGTQPSSVPASCVLQIDRRWIPGENYQDILQEYQDVLTALHQEDPKFQGSMKVMESSLMPDGFVHESCLTDQEHPLVPTLAKTVYSITGVSPAKTSFPGWTDAGLLNHYGQIPSLVFGPGKLESAHSPEERLPIAQLVPTTLIYAMTVVEFCGGVKGSEFNAVQVL